MKEYLHYLLFLSILFSSCSKKVIIDNNNYKWKNHEEVKNQSVDLSLYQSPNSREDQDSDKLVILCATGGGSRAASFTIGVMLELEKILNSREIMPIDSQRNILNEIDYFSTVSGGGWGSSTYIAFKYQQNKYGVNNINPYPTFNSFEGYLANWADRNYLKHQYKYMLGGLVSNSFYHTSSGVMMDRLNSGYLGWSYRAQVEEKLWKQNNQGAFNQDSVNEIKLSDIFILKESSKKPNLPMLIPNSTNLVNYMVVPFTPDRLQYWGLQQYTYTLGKGPTLEPNEPKGVLPIKALLEIPLAAGIKASSSVPGFIGSSIFASKKGDLEYTLRLEDGGITDNFGLHTAKAILNQETQITEKENRIVIIVDASASGIRSAKQNKNHQGRFYSVKKLVSAAPDAQYPITRERILALEKEYNCTIIYLGTEVLLDKNYGKGGNVSLNLSKNKSEVEQSLYSVYKDVRRDVNYFNNMNIEERTLLYEYIRSFVPTWFSAKSTNNRGYYIEDPDITNGSARVMFLVGRGVVQLKREEIKHKFHQNSVDLGKE